MGCVYLFDLVVPQDGCPLILHYLFWIVLVPVLHIHFDNIVLTYVASNSQWAKHLLAGIDQFWQVLGFWQLLEPWY